MFMEFINWFFFGDGTVTTSIVPLVMAAVGAGMGKMKAAEEKKREKRELQSKASHDLWSPWTGMKSDPVKKAIGEQDAMMQGAMSGMMMGQSMGGGAGGAVDPAAANLSSQVQNFQPQAYQSAPGGLGLGGGGAAAPRQASLGVNTNLAMNQTPAAYSGFGGGNQWAQMPPSSNRYRL